MTTTRTAIKQALAATNGGPGLTSRELADGLGTPEPWVRQTLSDMAFQEKVATCGADGRWKLGDPTPLLTMAL